MSALPELYRESSSPVPDFAKIDTREAAAANWAELMTRLDGLGKQLESVYRDAMGCEWMTVEESREAIPPAFTEHIGAALVAHLKAQVAA